MVKYQRLITDKKLNVEDFQKNLEVAKLELYNLKETLATTKKRCENAENENVKLMKTMVAHEF